jgi:hypothetical protein
MGYAQWFEKHAQKHKTIVAKLQQQNLSKEEIVEYFDFDNMKIYERDFCPLYAKDKKCHDINQLNCYLCACPNFRFSDNGIKEVGDATQFSYCAIDSKDGRQGLYGTKIHQDCTRCTVPHNKEYILQHFDLDWKIMMRSCQI